MPRRRTAARAPPAPARGFSTSAAPRQPPPPAPAYNAPPPAQPQQGGSMMGGIMGNIATGMALGTGSAIAHRAVDSAFGAMSGGGAPQQYHTEAQQVAQQEGPCALQAKQFSECMSATNGDMAQCQYYFEAMQQCRLRNQ